MKVSILCNKITPDLSGAFLIMSQNDQKALFDELNKRPRRHIVATFETPERDDGGMRGLFWSLIRLLALESFGEAGADAEESVYQGIIEQYGPPLNPYKGHTGRKSWSRCDTKEKCLLIEGAIAEVCACGMHYKNAVSVVNLMIEWKAWRYRQKDDPLIYATAEDYRARVPYCEACISTPGEHLAHIVSRGRGAETFADWNILHLCQGCHIEIQHRHGWDALLTRAPHLRDKIDKARDKFKGGING